MSEIYDLLNDAMHERFGGSVTRLSKACGVSVALGSRWVHEDESQRIVPGPKSCKKIADGLNLDPDYVLEAAGHREPRGTPVERPTRLAAFIAHVEAAFHAMTPQEWGPREEAGLALFSVPHDDPISRRKTSAIRRRNRHGNHTRPADSGPQDASSVWCAPLQRPIALAAFGS